MHDIRSIFDENLSMALKIKNLFGIWLRSHCQDWDFQMDLLAPEASSFFSVSPRGVLRVGRSSFRERRQ